MLNVDCWGRDSLLEKCGTKTIGIEVSEVDI